MEEKKTNIVTALLLATLSLALYWKTLGFDFVNLDDASYIYENPDIREGLTLGGLYTAFFGEKYLWIPLVWVSFMLDFELWGLDPGGYHLTNALLHSANSVLVFLVLRRMTATSKRSLWASAFVGAVFAVHPLHVESVAWITERKDVLFAFFWILAMWAYLRYSERPSPSRYLPVMALFAFSLMSKPMAVTLPLALLLLDLWPLGRLRRVRDATGLIIEKLPLFALSLGATAIAYLSAQKGGAVIGASEVTFMERAMNALISYVTYLKMTLYPANLAVFYPHPHTGVEPWKAVVSALVLVVITAAALLNARKRPYLIVGWLWFLITLIPAIGIIQSGAQALADRFMYVPLIGLSIIAAWGVPDLLNGLKDRLRLKASHLYAIPGTISAIVLMVLATLTFYQLRHWQNNFTLYGHALEVTQNNYLAHNNLAIALDAAGQRADAIEHYNKAISVNPAFPDPHFNLGVLYAESNRPLEAIKHLRRVLALLPDLPRALFQLGRVYADTGDFGSAVSSYERNITLGGEDALTLNNLGIAYYNLGRTGEAIARFERAVTLEPTLADAHHNLGIAYGEIGEAEKAFASMKKAMELGSRRK